MKTEQELENAVKQAHEELLEARRQLRLLKEEIYLPNLREKYERKYFKFINGTGTEGKDEVIYSYCHRLTTTDGAIVDSFRKSEGTYLFFVSIAHDSYLLETEITQKEYYAELNKMKSAFDKLYY